jgi:signal transduction histidine kinase
MILSGTNTDITARKNAENALRSLNETLEKRVAERTATLESRNEDLELFSYAVSHDLRAPVRAINGYAQLLGERMSGLTDHESTEFVDRIVASTVQISNMLDGILAYSRIGTMECDPSVVSLRRLITNIAEEVQSQTSPPSVDIRLDVEDLELVIDADAITICVRNLLHNAVKFSAGVASPLVRLSARAKGRTCEMIVRDNGIGFEMAHSHRIFEMFGRLHTNAPGSGVGLALVARAATRLGGTIDADAKPGKGATFTLEFPMNRR